MVVSTQKGLYTCSRMAIAIGTWGVNIFWMAFELQIEGAVIGFLGGYGSDDVQEAKPPTLEALFEAWKWKTGTCWKKRKCFWSNYFKCMWWSTLRFFERIQCTWMSFHLRHLVAVHVVKDIIVFFWIDRSFWKVQTGHIFRALDPARRVCQVGCLTINEWKAFKKL